MKKSFLAFLLFAFVVLPAMAAEKSNPLVLVMGKANAPIVVDDYSSLGCSHCADFHLNTLPALKKEYIDTGKVKLIFHHFPLDKASVDAALLVHCVPPEGAWDAINLLYYQQDQWARDTNYREKLVGYGAMLGLKDSAIKSCLNNTKMRDAILQGRIDAAEKQKINGTPTLIFNNGAQRTVGSQTIDQMRSILDKLQ